MEKQNKFIVTEQFAGTKSLPELFAELVILISGKKLSWNLEQHGIIEETTVESESCCSSSGGN